MTDLELRPPAPSSVSGRERPEEPNAEDLLVLAANRRPASMSAISELAENTVFGAGLSMSGAPGTVDLFADPFSGGLSEPVYVDGMGMLMHAWRPVGQDADADHGDRGWLTSHVADAIRQVKVVRHPNGAVYAFALSDLDGTLKVFELAVTGESLPYWREVTIPKWSSQNPILGLHVQYLDDTARTPVVFVIRTLWAGMSLVQTIFGAWNNETRPWEPRATYALTNSEAEQLFAIGYDDAGLAWLRYYVVDEAGDLRRTSHSSQGDKIQELVDTGWESGIGGFVGPTGFGALGLGADNTLLTFAQYDDNSVGGFGETKKLWLASTYSDLRVWQDGSGMLHLYGISQGNQLHVLHQLDWDPFDFSAHASFAPNWETVQGSDKNKATMGVMRPLVGGVASYALDAYPDQMPNQVVQHDVGGSESTVVYTQQVGTSYWEQETIRVNAPTTSLPSTQHRYQTRVLVQNSYGAPVAGCEVTITSDAPVDLDIAGQGYRVRPNLPATVSTDLTGTFTVSIPAVGLATPALHFAVAGVSNALSVQPAAEVHRFLAGAGTLPAHTGGLTEDSLQAARTPDGTAPLFPVLGAPTPSPFGEDWPPTAAEVLAWCQAAFAVSAGEPLPSALRAGLAPDAEIVAFAFQTHDPRRPATRVFAQQVDLERFRSERGLTGDSEWFGDAIEGLRASVLTATEVVVAVAASTLAALFDLANGAQVWLQARWDDAVSAAHATEAIFSALGAKVADVVAWLSWPFAFADVWATKKVLDDEVFLLADRVKQATAWLRDVDPETWTGEAGEAIDRALAGLAEVFGEQYFSRFESAGPQPGLKLPVEGLALQDFVRGPAINWLADLLRLVGYEGTAEFDGNPLRTMLEKLAALPEWEQFGPHLDVVTSAMYDLFDWSNPNSAKNIVVTVLLQTLEGVLKGGVALAAAALQIVLDFVDDVMDLLLVWGQQPVGSQTLQTVYDYVRQRAGQTGSETLSFSDLATLMAAYQATGLYKVAFGVAPFGTGATRLAELRVPDSVPAALGGSQPPEKWTSLKLFQGYFTAMMVADGPFDVQVNSIAISKAMGTPYWKPPKPYWVFWGFHHFFAYGIGDYPPFWGNDFPPQGWKTTDWGPTVMWLMSAVANTADLCCACEYETFIGIFEPDEDFAPGRVGPNIYFALGAFRMVISGLRYMDGEDRGYPFAIWNCAINVTSFESATTGWLRWALLERAQMNAPDVLMWLAAVEIKSCVDFTCDWFAGFASLMQIGYEDNWPPYIKSSHFPDAVAGQQWAALVEGGNGMTPYDWHFVAPGNLPPGTRPGLPPSLNHPVRGDVPTVTSLIGTPTKEDVGTWAFYLRMEDDYGPSFAYQTDELIQLTVLPPED